MGSLSAEEGRADKIFGWTDGVIFHFSLVVLVEVAEGSVASSPPGSAGRWHHRDKNSLSSIPAPCGFPIPNFWELTTHLLKELLQFPIPINF